MIETRSAVTQQSRDGLASLARITGKSLDEIVGLAERDELRSLFSSDGRLRTGPGVEHRAVPRRDTDAAIAGRQRAMAYELLAHQNHARLVDLAAKRLAWD
jgi:hypothetical protein